MRQRLFLYLVALPVVLYVALVVTLYIDQRNFIYFPDSNRANAAIAGISGLETSDLHTVDGVSLRSWFLPPPDRQAPVFVFLHGNGGNIAGSTEHLRHFAVGGAGALIVEYRGYGGNPGEPTEAELFRDVAAARQFLVDPKQFWLSPDAGHNDLLDHGSVEAAMAFVHRYVPD